ncbi:MAG: YjbQ family protein [Bacteroidetes bacterium]|nr:MAG: YjbQ family protein [Bacteroidota bacterium]RLD74197.1 MAG: YjbQ family protein [Bacteroidota bacterium]RLD89897.1 MAG: YjbQ family protein [Bacteroidota bacterium]
MIKQKEIVLPSFRKGFHIIDRYIEEAIGDLPEKGLLHIFIKHTSAGLMINENADPDVRTDMKTLLNKLAPEGAPFYVHTMEGPDDMPAHFKSSVFGQSLTVPVTNHRMNLGTWQSIYLCEFRDHGGARRLVVTLYY